MDGNDADFWKHYEDREQFIREQDECIDTFLAMLNNQEIRIMLLKNEIYSLQGKVWYFENKQRKDKTKKYVKKLLTGTKNKKFMKEATAENWKEFC